VDIDGAVDMASTLQVDGAATFTTEITANGGIALGDGDIATFGNSDDLKIYHDGSHSYISDTGQGDLKISGSSLVDIKCGDDIMFRATEGGSTQIRYDGLQKLATTSTGIDVTGTATMDGLTVEASSNALIRVSDSTNANQRLDLQHNGGIASIISGNNGAYGTIKLQAYNGTDTVDRFKISANGDVDLGYEDTGTTPKLTWDASAEKLTVDGPTLFTRPSTIKPSITNGTATLNLYSNTGSSGGYDRPVIQMRSASTTGGFNIKLKGDDANSLQLEQVVSNVAIPRFKASAGGDISFYEDTGTTAKMVWKASDERLGIGTSSPDAQLDIASATTSTLRLSNTDTILTENQITGQLEFYQSDVSGSPDAIGITGKIGMRSVPNLGGGYYGMAADMDFYVSGEVSGRASDNASLKAMTIQAGSGFVGIGTDSPTSALTTNVTADGAIHTFSKSGTTVGSIGTGNTRLYVGSYDTGISFAYDVDTIRPYNTTTGADRDNAINLGSSAARFKDLYLSGGVYLGGTGAANKLDDYEEGTFTPVIADAVTGGNEATANTAIGKYTKVGNLVTIAVDLLNIDTTGLTTGLAIILRDVPFQAANSLGGVNYTGSVLGGGTFNTPFTVFAAIQDNLQYVRFQDAEASGVSNFLNIGNMSSGSTDIRFSLTYQAA
jgi:hypothetical protein